MVAENTVTPCFMCGKELTAVSKTDEKSNQPYDGVAFRANGNFGSAVFDPEPDEEPALRAEINICDDCLVAHRDRVRVSRMSRLVRYEYKRVEGYFDKAHDQPEDG